MKLPLLAIAAVLATATAAWAASQEYQYPADGFAITLPAAPAYTATTQHAGDKTFERHDYLLDLGNGARLVVSATALPGTEGADEASTAQASAEAAVKQLQVTGAVYAPVTVGDHKGTQTVYERNGKQVKNRYFLIRGHLFVLTGAAPVGAYPASFDQGFASFRLL